MNHKKEPYMKKMIWIIAAVLVIAAIAIGTTFAMAATGGSPAPTPTPTATPAHTTVNINASDSGNQITLNAGDSLIVTLDSNTASTGFSWTNASISNASVVKEISRTFKEPDSKLIGASGQDIWTFKALEKGTSTISMNYSRPWETGVEPAATFNVTVIVK
jgi:inhibitor of cysteine peptidase